MTASKNWDNLIVYEPYLDAYLPQGGRAMGHLKKMNRGIRSPHLGLPGISHPSSSSLISVPSWPAATLFLQLQLESFSTVKIPDPNLVKALSSFHQC